MAIYVPTIQTGQLLAGMLEQKTWASLMASGVLDQSELPPLAQGGDFVTVPRLQNIADFVRTDVTSSSAASATAAATNDAKAVVLRSHSLNSWTDYQEKSSGADVGANLSRSVGEKMAKRASTTMFYSLSGAVDAIDSPSANCHTLDLGDAAVTADKIRIAKYKMGDEADALNTLVIHSAVWKDILYDLMNTYKIDVVSGAVVVSGKISGLLGVQNIIVSDLVRTQNTGTGTTTDDRYDSFLLGSGALYFGYQASPEVKVFNDITVVNDPTYLRVNAHYVSCPKGLAFGGSASPADSDLYNASNWTQKVESHKELRIVKIVSNGGQQG